MESTRPSRSFYVLLVMLIAALLLGGIALWNRTEPPPPPPPPPPGGAPFTDIPKRDVQQPFAMGVPTPPGADPSAAPTGQSPPGDPAWAGTPRDPRADRPARPGSSAIGMADLHRKLAEIRAMGQTTQARDALVALGREMAMEDFGNAVKLMGAVSDFFSKSALCRGIFELQGVRDPRRAMAAAAALDPGEFSSGSMGTYAQDKRIYYEALTATMKGWAFTDPESAAANLANVPEDYQQAAAGSVYSAWAEHNPLAAADSLSKLSPAIQRNVLPQLYASWAQNDPQGAWSHVLSLPEGTIENRRYILTSIASSWAQKDVAQAMSWMDSTLQDDREYADVVERVTRELSSTSPQTAAALIVSVPGLYIRQPNLLTSTIRSWVGNDPGAAANWALSIQDSDVRGVAIKSTAAYWSMQDTGAALDWAQSLPDTMDRAYALSNVAATEGQAQGNAAPDWILSLTDEFTRARALSGFVMGRVRRAGDSAAAEAIRNVIMSDTIDFVTIQSVVANAKISNEDKAALLDLIQ